MARIELDKELWADISSVLRDQAEAFNTRAEWTGLGSLNKGYLLKRARKLRDYAREIDRQLANQPVADPIEPDWP